MYGYTNDQEQVQSSSMKFGLNQKVFLTKFEFTANGGKEGAAQDALDVEFDVNGSTVSARQFPVTQVLDKDVTITDVNHPKFQEAIKQQSGWIVHVLSCFVSKEVLQQKLSGPFGGFADFAKAAAACLPAGFQTKELDVFLNYEWTRRPGQNQKYLRIPNAMKHGLWLCPHIPGNFVERRGTGDLGIYFEDTARNVKHPFTRTAWFANSAFAKQDRVESDGIDLNAGIEASSGDDPFALGGTTEIPVAPGPMTADVPDPFNPGA